MKTVDLYALATNAAAWAYWYAYVIEKTTGDKCDISNVASRSIDTVAAANVRPRLRKGGIDHAFDGTTDGFWVSLFFGPTNQTYWEDVTLAVYIEETI